MKCGTKKYAKGGMVKKYAAGGAVTNPPAQMSLPQPASPPRGPGGPGGRPGPIRPQPVTGPTAGPPRGSSPNLGTTAGPGGGRPKQIKPPPVTAAAPAAAPAVPKYAKGGMVKKYADGGMVTKLPNPMMPPQPVTGPSRGLSPNLGTMAGPGGGRPVFGSSMVPQQEVNPMMATGTDTRAIGDVGVRAFKKGGMVKAKKYAKGGMVSSVKPRGASGRGVKACKVC